MGKNKTQLQLDINELNTILSTANNLPTADSLKSGQYVWKKYKIIPAFSVTISQINSGSDPLILQLNSDNSDLLNIDELAGITGEISSGVKFRGYNVSSFILNNDNIQIFNAGPTGTSKYTYDNNTKQISLPTSYVEVSSVPFTWGTYNKEISKGSFDSYIIDSTPDKYPDNGIMDGYWYEKADQLSANLFEYKKISIDKFSFDNDIGSQEFVSHSLGEVPKMMIIIGHEITGGLKYMFTSPVITTSETLDGYVYTLYSSGYSTPSSTTKFNVNNARIQTVDYAYGYQGGKEYTLITMA